MKKKFCKKARNFISSVTKSVTFTGNDGRFKKFHVKKDYKKGESIFSKKKGRNKWKYFVFILNYNYSVIFLRRKNIFSLHNLIFTYIAHDSFHKRCVYSSILLWKLITTFSVFNGNFFLTTFLYFIPKRNISSTEFNLFPEKVCTM